MVGRSERRDHRGRARVSSRGEIEHVALELFTHAGFTDTTVDDIAAAAGISRRTFFRYFASKNDVVWGEFDTGLRVMESMLDAASEDVGLLDALTDAVVRFNAFPPDAVVAHRQRMELILHVPALQAHSTLRYTAWRAVVARFAARRLAQPAQSLLPQLVAHVCLGAAVAAYEAWLRDDAADLSALLGEALATVRLRLPGG